MPHLPEDGRVARFVSESKWWHPASQRWRSLMPSQTTLRSSTYHIDGWSEEEAWKKGDELAQGCRPPRSCVGRLEGAALIFIKENLSADYDDNPHGHLNWIGWPQARDTQVAVAKQLASAMKAVQRI
jgi:hypothetical protein